MASAADSQIDPEKRDRHPFQMPKPHQLRLLTRVSWAAEEAIDNYAGELNWTRCVLHFLAMIYLCFILCLTFWVLPFPGHWSPARQVDKAIVQYQDLSNYFGSFQGYSECNIRAEDLYLPLGQDVSKVSHDAYCPRRKGLLEAMSSGGRIGFDAPYFPKDCHYRWYSVAEICMILERFGAIVFVGDDSLQTIYNGLNVLLRQNLAHGALKTWDMDKDTLHQCRCGNQFTSKTCAEHFITSSDEVTNQDVGLYTCSRTPHAFLSITSSPAPSSVINKFKQLVPRVKRSNYHPVPIIHSLSPSTSTPELATSSLEEFLALADNSHRKTPMLWIGPTASGHTEIRGRKGNQEIWDFDRQLRTVAEDNDVEVLGMWNLTVQSNSWDGMRFGEKVAVTQAMMVVNWLARLESS